MINLIASCRYQLWKCSSIDRVSKPALDVSQSSLEDELGFKVNMRYISSPLNQIWSGKWCLCADYLFKIGKAPSPLCCSCFDLGIEVVDDICHKLFICLKFEKVRSVCFGSSPFEAEICDYVGRNTIQVARFIAMARDRQFLVLSVSPSSHSVDWFKDCKKIWG